MVIQGRLFIIFGVIFTKFKKITVVIDFFKCLSVRWWQAFPA